jgi:hypothetical protein
MTSQTGAHPRSHKQLFDATIPFAADSTARSWWHVGSTLAVLIALLVGAAVAPGWYLRLAASITANGPELILVVLTATWPDSFGVQL